jgi:tetratricopeptide (TPR) repeat protein
MSWKTLTWVIVCGTVWSLAGEQSLFAQRQKRNAAPVEEPGDADLSPDTTPDGDDSLFPRPEAPSSPIENIVRQAQAAYQQQDYAQCIDLTTQVLDANPRHSVARYHRASAQIDLGRRDRSVQKIRAGIADAREALGIAGKQYLIFHIPYFYGLTSLAEIENKRAHADLTISVATPLLTREDLPANVKPLVYYQRALAKVYLKDYLGAAADYGEAVKLDPKFQSAHFGRADAFLKAKDPVRARASFDLAVNMLPNDALVFNKDGSMPRLPILLRLWS